MPCHPVNYIYMEGWLQLKKWSQTWWNLKAFLCVTPSPLRARLYGNIFDRARRETGGDAQEWLQIPPSLASLFDYVIDWSQPSRCIYSSLVLPTEDLSWHPGYPREIVINVYKRRILRSNTLQQHKFKYFFINIISYSWSFGNKFWIRI